MSDVELEEHDDPYYRKPEKKSVQEILSADSGDDALDRYKASLLGGEAASAQQIIIDPTDPRVVLPLALELMVGGEVKDKLDLSTASPDGVMRLKEGVNYQLRLSFCVQREIVTGLRYLHRVSKLAVTLEKESYMLGSYAPKSDTQYFNTPQEKAPEGMLQRGKYKIKSKLIDDDGHEYLSWQWHLDIVKDW